MTDRLKEKIYHKACRIIRVSNDRRDTGELMYISKRLDELLTSLGMEEDGFDEDEK